MLLAYLLNGQYNPNTIIVSHFPSHLRIRPGPLQHILRRFDKFVLTEPLVLVRRIVRIRVKVLEQLESLFGVISMK